MSETVVDAFERVDVAEDEGERAAETLGAPQLVLERGLRVAAVREPGEPVDQRLLLDDGVQPRVVERNDGVCRERHGGGSGPRRRSRGREGATAPHCSPPAP